MLLILFLYLICASTFTLSKATLSIAAPFFYVAIRMVCAGVVLIGISLLYKKRIEIIPSQWGLFLQIVLFHVYCAYIFDIWAMQYLASWQAAFIYNMSPFISAAIGYLQHREIVTKRQFGGMVIGSLSIAPFLLYSTTTDSGGVIPVFVMLFAVASSAYAWTVMRTLLHTHNYSYFTINGVGMLGGGLLAAMTSYAFEQWQPLPVSDWPAFLWQVFAVILLSNVLFYNLYGYLLLYYSPTLLSSAGSTCPFFAAVLGILFLQEQVTWQLFFCGATSLVGVYLFYKEELKKRRSIQ